MDIIYNYPLGIGFTVFVGFFTLLSLIGLYFFNIITMRYTDIYRDCFDVSTTIISIVAVFLGVSLSFLIITVWTSRAAASIHNKNEAEAAYSLYKLFGSINHTEAQHTVRQYVEDIINNEFPILQDGGTFIDNNELIRNIRELVYSIDTSTPRETLILDKIMLQFDKLMTSRVQRLSLATSSIENVLWILISIYVCLLIFMSWIINCKSSLHYIIVAIISIYVFSSIFVILILSNPYRGLQGLTSEPYQRIFDLMN